jgi:hypothetical protein
MHLQYAPMAVHPVSLLAALQGSPAGTHTLSLTQPLLRLTVDPQSAGLALYAQHCSLSQPPPLLLLLLLAACWYLMAWGDEGVTVGSAWASPKAESGGCE